MTNETLISSGFYNFTSTQILRTDYLQHGQYVMTSNMFMQKWLTININNNWCLSMK